MLSVAKRRLGSVILCWQYRWTRGRVEGRDGLVSAGLSALPSFVQRATEVHFVLPVCHYCIYYDRYQGLLPAVLTAPASFSTVLLVDVDRQDQRQSHEHTNDTRVLHKEKKTNDEALWKGSRAQQQQQGEWLVATTTTQLIVEFLLSWLVLAVPNLGQVDGKNKNKDCMGKLRAS